MTKSLSFRLGLAIVFAILITSVFATTGVVWRAVDRQTEERGLEIRAMAQVLSASISSAVSEQNRVEIHRGLRTIQYSSRISFAQINAPDGTRLAHIGQRSVLLTDADDVSWTTRLKRFLDPRGIIEDVEIRHGGKTVGVLRLVGETPGARSALIAEFKNAAWWAFAAVLIGLYIAYRQQRRIIRPIGTLTDVMARVSEGNELPSRIDIKGVGEVGVLVGSYNAMIEQVARRDKVIADHTEGLEQTVDDRTRELRVARDLAEQAADAKARFLATMSHEIRTPMNGVLVMAELLARSDLKAEQKGYARVIAQSGETLLDLLNDILDISKFDADHVALESVPVPIDDLVNDAVMIFWEQARAKGVELVASVSAHVPSEIEGDPKRLRQCLANLIGNALKFTTSGYVAVDVSMGDDRSLCLAVRDTGVGISEDRQQAIFEAFEQEDRSTSRTHGGTGLGLAIVSRLAEAMGGDVAVTSALGEGSCFTLRIPLAGADELARDPFETACRVAVACDERPALRDRLEGQLSEAGLQIVSSADHPDCLIASFESDAVLDAKCPVVGLWPFGTPEPRAMLEAETVVDVLPVPFTRETLHGLIARIVDVRFLGMAAIQSSSVAAFDAVEDYSSLRVLVADDGAVNRQVLQDALAVYGVEPVMVEDGAQALERAAAAPFDLILLDGTMPVLDGYAAAKQIRDGREFPHTSDAKVILFTASLDGVSEDEWRKSGFDGTLSKPFRMDELSELLHTCRGDEAAPRRKTPVVDVPARDAAEDVWISPSVLETLYALDAKRPGALRRVYERFAETLPGYVEAVQAAILSGDADAVRRTAHGLKSVAGSAGALQLAELAADLEIEAISLSGDGRAFDATSDAPDRVRRLATATLDVTADILTAAQNTQVKVL